MLPLMQRNTALNDLQDIVKPSVYDWGQPTPTALPAHPDVILAADCCYFEPAFPLLLRTLQDLIGERTVCYFACVKRRKADAQFMKAARKVFEVEAVDDDPYVEEYRGKNVFLWVILSWSCCVYFLLICLQLHDEDEEDGKPVAMGTLVREMPNTLRMRRLSAALAWTWMETEVPLKSAGKLRYHVHVVTVRTGLMKDFHNTHHRS
jgi:hypothetical protein